MDAKKGTTTVVLVCKTGVVLAADKQASAGGVIASKTTRKIFPIDDSIAITIAGGLGDSQNFVSLLKAEVAFRKMEENCLSTQAVASLASRILHGNRAFPYITWLILSGYDESPRAFAVDVFGGLNEDLYVASGSGMQIVHGILEDQFREGLDLEEGVDLALRAIHSAQKRDQGTGGGIALSVITKAGYREFSEEEIQKRMTRL